MTQLLGDAERQETEVAQAVVPGAEETPNQRRRRLGLPIEASFPTPDYGEKLETPNQQRARLGLPVEASFPTPEFGVREETPNQRRHGLASARTGF